MPRAVSERADTIPSGNPISTDTITDTRMIATVCMACSHRSNAPINQMQNTIATASSHRRPAA